MGGRPNAESGIGNRNDPAVMRIVFALAAMCAMKCALVVAASQGCGELHVSTALERVAATVQAGTAVSSTNGNATATMGIGAGGEMRLVVQDFSDATRLATTAWCRRKPEA